MNTPKDTQFRRPHFWLRAIEFRKHELTRAYRASLKNVAREGISDADYATTMATLEKMAANLGWDESQQAEHGFGHHHRHGHRHPGMMRGMRGHRRHHEQYADNSATPAHDES